MWMSKRAGGFIVAEALSTASALRARTAGRLNHRDNGIPHVFRQASPSFDKTRQAGVDQPVISTNCTGFCTARISPNS